jgi:hypothetical protein
VTIERLSLGQADYNGQPLLQQLRGRLASDGRQHRLDDLQLQAGDVSLAGQASLDGLAPFRSPPRSTCTASSNSGRSPCRRRPQAGSTASTWASSPPRA